MRLFRIDSVQIAVPNSSLSHFWRSNVVISRLISQSRDLRYPLLALGLFLESIMPKIAQLNASLKRLVYAEMRFAPVAYALPRTT